MCVNQMVSVLKSYIFKYCFNQSQNMKTKIKLGIYKSWVPARSLKHWYPRLPEPEKLKKSKPLARPKPEKIQLTHH